MPLDNTSILCFLSNMPSRVFVSYSILIPTILCFGMIPLCFNSLCETSCSKQPRLLSPIHSLNSAAVHSRFIDPSCHAFSSFDDLGGIGRPVALSTIFSSCGLTGVCNAVNPGTGMPLREDLRGGTFLRCSLIGHIHKVGGASLVSVSAREAY